MTEIEQLKEKLIHLRLKAMASQLDSILNEASKENLHFLATLERLLDIETEHRWHNAISLRFVQSKLKEKITIDQKALSLDPKGIHVKADC